MFVEARELSPDSIVEADVCIIGGGAAGMTLGRELFGSKLRVVILESGGRQEEDATVDLARGESVGHPYHPLHTARRRFWGGSTNCWAGLCAPLDPLDFRVRPWVPHSGWPFERAELDPYYPRAHELLRLGPFDYGTEHWTKGKRAAFTFGPDAPIESAVFQRARDAKRLGRVLEKDFERADNVTVYLHANATRIALDPAGKAVSHVEVRVLEGPAFRVRARRYVLATGGLENPRLLLASNDVHAAGVGNQNDLVGRYFMEHPHTNDEGIVIGSPAMRDWDFYRAWKEGKKPSSYKVWGHLRPTAAAQREHELVNVHVVLFEFQGRRKKMKRVHEAPLADALSDALADTDGGDAGKKPLQLTFGTPSEQSPNPNSRVTLSDTKRDALGVPRLRLDWRLSEIDLRSIARVHELIAESLGRGSLGRVLLTLDPAAREWPEQMYGGWHHMGTTRMHEDPKRGVCDARGYVHGVDNLLVAGSSLFPTSGAANPTLTIIALCMRAADHLEQVLA